MPIKLNFKDAPADGTMPWYWMALLSHKHSGLFWTEEEGQDHVYIQAVDDEVDLEQLPEAINTYMDSQHCDYANVVMAERVDEIPKNATPLYQDLITEGNRKVRALGSMTSSHLDDILAILKERIERLITRVGTKDRAAAAIAAPKSHIDLERSVVLYHKAINLEEGMGNGIANSFIFNEGLKMSIEDVTVPDTEFEDEFHYLNLSVLDDQYDAHQLAAKLAIELDSFTTGRTHIADKINDDGTYNLVYIQKGNIAGFKESFIRNLYMVLYKFALESKVKVDWSSSSPTLDGDFVIPNRPIQYKVLTYNKSFLLGFRHMKSYFTMNDSYPEHARVMGLPEVERKAYFTAAGQAYINESKNEWVDIDGHLMLLSNEVKPKDDGFRLRFVFNGDAVTDRQAMYNVSKINKQTSSGRFFFPSRTRIWSSQDESHRLAGQTAVFGRAPAPEILKPIVKAVLALEKISEDNNEVEFKVNMDFANLLCRNSETLQEFARTPILEVRVKYERAIDSEDYSKFAGLEYTTGRQFMGGISPYVGLSRHLLENDEIRRDVLTGGIIGINMAIGDRRVTYRYQRGLSSAALPFHRGGVDPLNPYGDHFPFSQFR